MTLLWRLAAVLLGTACWAMLGAPADAVEQFKRLSDQQIRAKLAGMEITDDVHWAEQYMKDGTVKIFSMGKATVGTWAARDGELCIEARPEDTNCFEVWLSGIKVEMRLPGGIAPLDGILQPQSRRN